MSAQELLKLLTSRVIACHGVTWKLCAGVSSSISYSYLIVPTSTHQSSVDMTIKKKYKLFRYGTRNFLQIYSTQKQETVKLSLCLINCLTTKVVFYLNYQFVPRSKNYPSRFKKKKQSVYAAWGKSRCC